jgi:hypothetical protein
MSEGDYELSCGKWVLFAMQDDARLCSNRVRGWGLMLKELGMEMLCSICQLVRLANWHTFFRQVRQFRPVYQLGTN